MAAYGFYLDVKGLLVLYLPEKSLSSMIRRELDRYLTLLALSDSVELANLPKEKLIN